MKSLAVDLLVYATILLLIVFIPSEWPVFVGIGLAYGLVVLGDSVQQLRRLFR